MKKNEKLREEERIRRPTAPRVQEGDSKRPRRDADLRDVVRSPPQGTSSARVPWPGSGPPTVPHRHHSKSPGRRSYLVFSMDFWATKERYLGILSLELLSLRRFRSLHSHYSSLSMPLLSTARQTSRALITTTRHTVKKEGAYT